MSNPFQTMSAANDEPMLGPVIVAEFDSEDSCCGMGIQAGDDIQSDGMGGWIHVGCSSAEAGRRPRYCGTCLTVHAGACAPVPRMALGTQCVHCFCYHAGECV